MNHSSAQQTLLFIPDISGFTQFVSETAITHSQHIIEELLEVLIDANEIELELSEIEGDALLFYRKGNPPTATNLMAQIQRMYINFHAHLKKYETYRICGCGACCSANKLQLKFVAHYGEVADKKVKEHQKLFGKDVIVAHRLLKNSVPHEEYALFSNQLSNAISSWTNVDRIAWADIAFGEDDYDFGSVQYSYLELTGLEDLVPEPEIEDHSIPGATARVFSSENIIKAPIDVVFDVVSDYDFRPNYVSGQKGSDQHNHTILQNGSRHRCILDSGGYLSYVAHNYTFKQHEITYVESDSKNKMSVVWKLIALDRNSTQVSMTSFIKPSVIKTLLFNLFLKKRMVKNMAQTWCDLNEYCQRLVKENRRHSYTMELPEEVTQFD